MLIGKLSLMGYSLFQCLCVFLSVCLFLFLGCGIMQKLSGLFIPSCLYWYCCSLFGIETLAFAALCEAGCMLLK